MKLISIFVPVLLFSTIMMRINLAEIAKIRFGLYSQPEENGDAAYLLVRHFDDHGVQSVPVDAYLQVDGMDEGHFLKEGDVLLAGKGQRNFAWTYQAEMGLAVASSVFFVIRPDVKRVLPDYLTTIFNTRGAQGYFQSLASGTSMPSIRKSELEAFPVFLPSMETQNKVVKLKKLYEREMELSSKIVWEKQKLFEFLINGIINKEYVVN